MPNPNIYVYSLYILSEKKKRVKEKQKVEKWYNQPKKSMKKEESRERR